MSQWHQNVKSDTLTLELTCSWMSEWDWGIEDINMETSACNRWHDRGGSGASRLLWQCFFRPPQRRKIRTGLNSCVFTRNSDISLPLNTTGVGLLTRLTSSNSWPCAFYFANRVVVARPIRHRVPITLGRITEAELARLPVVGKMVPSVPILMEREVSTCTSPHKDRSCPPSSRSGDTT
jgi:hypothetical protein